MSKSNIIIKQAGTVFMILATLLSLSVTIARGQQCTRANPTVTINPSSLSAFPGQEVTFTITVTNNDSAGCPASSFLVMATFPEAGFVHTPDCVRVVLAPGQSASRTVRIKVPGPACVGPLTFRETAVNESASSFSGFADATIDVVPIVPDCGRAAPTVTITPNSQAALSGEQLTYLVTVKNNDDLSCGGSDFLVTSTLPSRLNSQTPDRFTLFVPAGGTSSRAVIIRSELFASDDLVFTETATHACATCLQGTASATFEANISIAGFTACCKKKDHDTILDKDTYSDCRSKPKCDDAEFDLDCLTGNPPPTEDAGVPTGPVTDCTDRRKPPKKP